MVRKNDISSFASVKKNDKGVLKEAIDKRKAKTRTIKKKKSEKETYRITLFVTPAEGEALEKKAGLVKIGTFVKHQIRTKTDIFK